MIKKEFITINNRRQGMFISQKDEQAPILIFVHGGPGSPEFPLFEEDFLAFGIHDYFTVYYPEQYGAGISYKSGLTANELTKEKIIDDTIALAEILVEKYQKKIYIMGHSWGTFVSTYVIKKAPQLFEAYFGVGQIGNQFISESLTYEFIKENAEKTQYKKLLRKIAKAPVLTKTYFSSIQYLQLREQGLRKYRGGLFYQKDISHMDLLKKLLKTKRYTCKEKINYLRGSSLTLKSLWGTVIDSDLTQLKEFKVPVYIFQGKHDYQTTLNQATAFFTSVNAPKKQMFIYGNSAHCPFVDEQELFLQNLLNIIK
jgi:Predicted hydrolases or acyltransferases (alpha/beta hydrolase superfamily)